MVVTQLVTYRNGQGFNTGTAVDEVEGLTGFLDRILRAIAGVGVVLLDGWAAERLQLPVGALPEQGEGKRHPAAVAAREAGWEVSEIHRWSMFRRTDGREIHVGLLEFLDQDHYPLIATDGRYLDTAAALDAWQDLSGGVPYWGDPGDAVNHLIQQTARPLLNRRPIVPAWRPRPPQAVGGAFARTFCRAGFDLSADMPGRWLVGYDATRAYLSAMTTVEVAPLPLRATGRREFRPGIAGWWLVDLSPWTERRLPAPWGYYPDGQDRDGLVWLTSEDLTLLSKLAGGPWWPGGGFTVIDSFTGPADRQVMRPAADRLREMWTAAATLTDKNDERAIRDTISAGYKAAHGKWRSVNGEIMRPDWAATLVATARCNLWRRIATAAAAGWFPAYVDGIDTVYYATDAVEGWGPTGGVHNPPAVPGIVTDRFPLNTGGATDRLGTFRAKYLTERTPA